MKLPINFQIMPKSYLVDRNQPITILIGSITIDGVNYPLHYNVAVKGMFYGDYNTFMVPVITNRTYNLNIEVDYILFKDITTMSDEYNFLLESLNYYYNSVEHFNRKKDK